MAARVSSNTEQVVINIHMQASEPLFFKIYMCFHSFFFSLRELFMERASLDVELGSRHRRYSNKKQPQSTAASEQQQREKERDVMSSSTRLHPSLGEKRILMKWTQINNLFRT